MRQAEDSVGVKVGRTVRSYAQSVQPVYLPSCTSTFIDVSFKAPDAKTVCTLADRMAS